MIEKQRENLPVDTPGLFVKLTNLERAERVFLSQGKGLTLIKRLTEDELARLAELTTPEGRILPGARVGLQAVLAEYGERNKATGLD